MSSFCCPICGTTISNEDCRCRVCDAPLAEMGYAFNKAYRARTSPKIRVDIYTKTTKPLEQILCPSCGARASNFYRECHACGFPLRREIEEGYAPVLRTGAGFAERRSVAIDPRASSVILKALSNDALPFVRRGVAANPSAPEEVLASLAMEGDPSMRAAVASNESTPGETLAMLSRDDSDSVKRQVVLNNASPQAARTEALSTMQSATLEEFAKGDSPEWLLSALAGSDDKRVRSKVAANPACAPDVYEQLSHDQEESVRVEVAKNLSAAESTLVAMAEDVSPSIRYELAKNPHVPIAVREALSSLEDVRFVARKAITHRMDPPSVEAEKIRDHIFSPKVEGRSIASSPATSEETIRELANQANGPLEACLGNPTAPPDVVRKIVRSIEGDYVLGKDDQRKYTVARIAGREDLDDETMHLLATSHYEWVLRHIADDPRISDEDLEELSRHYSHLVRAVAARNPKATEEMLERLAFDKDEDVRLSVLWNPRVPRELISVIDCRKSKQAAEVLKARNPDIPSEDLEQICPASLSNYECDPKTVARTEVAQNPAASAALLDALARDSYREVRQAVLRNANAPERVTKIAQSNDAPTPIKGRERIPKKWNTYSDLHDLQWIWHNSVVGGGRKSDIDYDFLYGVRRVRQMSYLEWLAKDESAPIFIFERIASDTDTHARKNLATNRCTPSHIQQQLAFDKSADVRLKLSESDFTTPDVLDILGYDVDNRVRKEARLRLRKLLL